MIGSVFGLVGKTIKSLVQITSNKVEYKVEEAKERHKTRINVEKNNQNLALSKTSFNNEFDQRVLKGSKSWTSFLPLLLVGAPFVVAYFSPSLVKQYFEVIKDNIPTFWTDTFVIVILGVGGLNAVKNPIGSLLSLVHDFKEKRKKKE